MKTYKLTLLAVLLASTSWLLTSCSQDNVIEQEHEQTMTRNICAMTFNGALVPFSIDVANHVQTRAASSEWADGTTLYIVFSTSSSSIYGTATYNASRGWSISYTGTLPSSQAGKCKVYYFESPSKEDYSSVQLSSESIVYLDDNGYYEYNQATNTCVVNSTLAPAVSRIRFKGANGTKITLSGISQYVSYTFSNGQLNATTTDIDLTVGSSGYTPYVYGFLEEESNREMSVTNGDYIYTTICGNGVFALGESGYMNIPTTTSHNGWTVKQAMQTSGAVDLGLSVKWAACNLGALSPEEYGDYYAWGETATKDDYSSTTYLYIGQYGSYTNIGENIAGTQYDAAFVKLGGAWRMPTTEQIQELIDKCSIEEMTYKGIVGQQVKGPNGQYIFIPISGYKDGRSIKNRGEYGYALFWASQFDTSYTGSSAYGYWGSSDRGQTHTWNRMYGLPIRPVQNK